MLKIRLQRLGRKKRPIYRLVVAEHSAPIKGRYVEALGHYDPFLQQNNFTFNEEKMRLWIKKGAKPTDTVARLMKGMGVQGLDSYVIQMADRKKKNPTEAELAAEAAAKAPAEPAVEKEVEPVAEAPAEPEASSEAPTEDEKPVEAA